MNWRELVAKMEPNKKYYIDNLMRLTDERGVVILTLIRAAGKYIEDHGGQYQLTFDGEALRKEMVPAQ
jgi:hypothetical protein